MKQVAIIIVTVVLLAGGWFFASPLFIDKAVDEDFDFILASGAVDMSRIMSMPEAERMSMKDAIMDAAANAPDATVGETMPADAPAVVAQGQFVDADAIHKGSGRATLYRLQDGSHAVRFEDFRTSVPPTARLWSSTWRSIRIRRVQPMWQTTVSSSDWRSGQAKRERRQSKLPDTRRHAD